jgi:hypothetical protein
MQAKKKGIATSGYRCAIVSRDSSNPCARKGTHNRLIFWRLEALLFGVPSQNFARDRIVLPKESVLDILL